MYMHKLSPERAAFYHRMGANVFPRNIFGRQHQVGWAAASDVRQGMPTVNEAGEPLPKASDAEVADYLREGIDEIERTSLVPLSESFIAGAKAYIDVATQPEPTERNTSPLG